VNLDQDRGRDQDITIGDARVQGLSARGVEAMTERGKTQTGLGITDDEADRLEEKEGVKDMIGDAERSI